MIILAYPDPHLLTKTKPVDKVTPELVETANTMYKTMIEAGGVGLAANQVGLDMSLVVLEDAGKPLILFNPVIIKRNNRLEYGPEGCLSFVGITRIIKRPTEVTIKYRDINNRLQYAVLRGLQARAMVHEYSHLFGVLFIDEPVKENNDQKTN